MVQTCPYEITSVSTIGNPFLITGKRTGGKLLRLSSEKPQHNRGVQSKRHDLFPVTAGDAFTN